MRRHVATYVHAAWCTLVYVCTCVFACVYECNLWVKHPFYDIR